jgi:hypothetical protein
MCCRSLWDFFGISWFGRLVARLVGGVRPAIESGSSFAPLSWTELVLPQTRAIGSRKLSMYLLATLCHIGDLRSRCRVVSSNALCLGGVRVAGNSWTFPCDSHGDFQIALSHLLQSGGSQSESAIRSRSHSPASDRRAMAR